MGLDTGGKLLKMIKPVIIWYLCRPQSLSPIFCGPQSPKNRYPRHQYSRPSARNRKPCTSF